MKPFILCLSLLATQCASAQDGPSPHMLQMAGPMRHDVMFFTGAEMERDRIVQNAPYCADAVHESVRTLADGNRIVQRQQSRQCRDAQGRTRQEIGMGSKRHVYLRDPVAGETWLLDPESKTATRMDLGRRAPQPDADASASASPGMDKLREWSREMRDWGREMGHWARDRFRGPMDSKPPAAPQAPMPEMPAMPPMPPVPVRIVIDGPHMGAMPPPPPLGPVPPAIAFHARMGAPRGPGTVNTLPAETIEGVRADGKRTTWTIEAGRIGNEKPIVISRDVWTSPELQITLRSKDSDPLAGEDSLRLQNIVRGEPDAALLRVPDDYRKAGPHNPRKL